MTTRQKSAPNNPVVAKSLPAGAGLYHFSFDNDDDDDSTIGENKSPDGNSESLLHVRLLTPTAKSSSPSVDDRSAVSLLDGTGLLWDDESTTCSSSTRTCSGGSKNHVMNSRVLLNSSFESTDISMAYSEDTGMAEDDNLDATETTKDSANRHIIVDATNSHSLLTGESRWNGMVLLDRDVVLDTSMDDRSAISYADFSFASEDHYFIDKRDDGSSCAGLKSIQSSHPIFTDDEEEIDSHGAHLDQKETVGDDKKEHPTEGKVYVSVCESRRPHQASFRPPPPSTPPPPPHGTSPQKWEQYHKERGKHFAKTMLQNARKSHDCNKKGHRDNEVPRRISIWSRALRSLRHGQTETDCSSTSDTEPGETIESPPNMASSMATGSLTGDGADKVIRSPIVSKLVQSTSPIRVDTINGNNVHAQSLASGSSWLSSLASLASPSESSTCSFSWDQVIMEPGLDSRTSCEELIESLGLGDEAQLVLDNYYKELAKQSFARGYDWAEALQEEKKDDGVVSEDSFIQCPPFGVHCKEFWFEAGWNSIVPAVRIMDGLWAPNYNAYVNRSVRSFAQKLLSQ